METKQLIDVLEKYFKSKPEIDIAYLFGSCARGERYPLSDTDIAVLVNKKTVNEETLKYRAELTADLMSLLKSNQLEFLLRHALYSII